MDFKTLNPNETLSPFGEQAGKLQPVAEGKRRDSLKDRGRMTTCPLCQFQLDSAKACVGCGLTSHCTMIKCPNCGYEFVEESKIVGLFRKIKKFFEDKL